MSNKRRQLICQRATRPALSLADAARRGSSRSSRADLIILACFLGSGMTALLYEVLWARMITNVTGGAPFAVAIVLMIFMGGIGAGSWIGGKLADRQPDPTRLVRVYAWLELVIGAYAVLVPLIVIALQPVYGWIYNRLFEHFLLYNVLTFVGCSVVLALPVLCMGATMPVVCRLRIRELRSVSASMGLLYALNTAGAAAGAWLGGMVLVPRLGVNGTLAAAVALNVVIGGIALRLGRRKSGPPATAPNRLTPSLPVTPATGDVASKSLIAGALLIFGVSGFCSMSYEVIWTRLLSLIVGPTNYSFTIILVTFIFGLALGSFTFGRLGDRSENPEVLLVTTQLCAGVLALVVSQMLGGSQLFFAKLLLLFKDNFPAQNLAKTLALFGFLILPTLCLGATFPLVGRICARRLGNFGRTIGVAYAINSAGAVLGSFVAGFILIPLLGKEHGLGLVVAIQVVAAMTGAMLMRRASSSFVWRVAGSMFAVAALASALFLPRWNHLILASSKYHRLDALGPLLRSVGWFESLVRGPRILAQHDPRELVYYGDGIGGFTTVCRSTDALGVPEYSMAISGKFDASSRGDMNTQALLAHVPMVFHPDARSVLVIGLASGITAGEVLHYPVDRLDIVEISEQAAKASDFFRPWNNRVLDSPKTRLIIQDARAHVRLSRNVYDVIICEPSNPWMAGCAALFTHEFFRDVKERLAEDGIFVQWLHIYQIDWDSVELIGRTFLSVFPNAALVSTSPTQIGSDYLLVGFKSGAGLPEEHAPSKASHVYTSPNVVLKDPRLLYRLIVSDNCSGVFGPGPLNTENQPRLEFEAPRQLHRSRANASEVIRRLLQTKHLPDTVRAYLNGPGGTADAQLDFTEFALSIFEPFEGMFQPARANDAQKARFTQMLGRYCASNEIDLTVIQDSALRDYCTALQLEAIKRLGNVTVTNAHATFYRAALHKAAGHASAALEDYRRCVQLDPTDVQSLNEIGILLARSGQATEAVNSFQRVLEMEPDQAEAHANLAVAYYHLGNRLGAEMHFREALRIDPTLQEAREGLRLLQSRKQR
jgi:spermidine synthase